MSAGAPPQQAEPPQPDAVEHTWQAEVRYGEVDQQGVVFNAHYLLYSDEAMGHFCRQVGLNALMMDIQLVSANLVWQAPARFGQTVTVAARCVRLGRTSFTMVFDTFADGRPCCRVETVYVLTDGNGTAIQLDGEQRAALGGGRSQPSV